MLMSKDKPIEKQYHIEISGPVNEFTVKAGDKKQAIAKAMELNNMQLAIMDKQGVSFSTVTYIRQIETIKPKVE